jgi:hypothetical protein
VQVRDAIAVSFQTYHNAGRELRVRSKVEQYDCGRPHQTPRPVGDDAGPDDTHQRVHPDRSGLALVAGVALAEEHVVMAERIDRF